MKLTLIITLICCPIFMNAQHTITKKFENSFSIGYGYELRSKNGFMDLKYKHLKDKWIFSARLFRHSFEESGSYKSYALSDTTDLVRSQLLQHKRTSTHLELGYQISKHIHISGGIILGANNVTNTIGNSIFIWDSLSYNREYNSELTQDYEYEVLSPDSYNSSRHLAAEMTQIVYGAGMTIEFITPIIKRVDIVFRYSPEIAFYSTLSSQAIYARDNVYTSHLPTQARFKHFASINARFKF
ncbi:MAG: hypothetical protein ACI8ZM_004599 [Crocinitomix sp.]|jgi:hypothetical protein